MSTKSSAWRWLRRVWVGAREVEWNWSLLGYLGLSGKVVAVLTTVGGALIAFLTGWAVVPALCAGGFLGACATVIIAGARAPVPVVAAHEDAPAPPLLLPNALVGQLDVAPFERYRELQTQLEREREKHQSQLAEERATHVARYRDLSSEFLDYRQDVIALSVRWKTEQRRTEELVRAIESEMGEEKLSPLESRFLAEMAEMVRELREISHAEAGD